jgi:hypothetical protein
MFKKENCAQKQQIIIAWLGIRKLAEVIKTNLGDQYRSELFFRFNFTICKETIKYITYFHKGNIKLNNAINLNISAKFDSNLLCGFRKKDENVKFP